MKLLILLAVATVASCTDMVEDYSDFEEFDDEAAEDRAGGGNIGYTYGKTKEVAPNLWNTVFDDYCGGQTQSPINLKNAMKMSCGPFTFTGYNKKPTKMMITNNGHTAQITLDMSPMPTVSGGCLSNMFEFLQMHWHWGSKDKKGSEHKIDGKAYAAELHLVHWNKGMFASANEAINSGHPNALAVLGIMLEVGKLKKNAQTPYKDLLKKLKKIQKSGSKTMMQPGKKLDLFLPKSLDFYRYNGSLTTPNCNEIVEWTVFKKPFKMSTPQILGFRKLRDSHGDKLVNNFRPPQSLNGRMIYKSK